MRLTMPSGTPEGIPLTVMPFREDAVIGTMSLATLVRLVPSPRQEEDPRALKAASGHDRRHAELRATVQRTLKGEPVYWDGVCASVGFTGQLNFSGGVKDSAGRVAGALLDPNSESGRKIRGVRS